MRRRHIKAEHVGYAGIKRILLEGCDDGSCRVSPYDKRLLWLGDAFDSAVKANLRIDRKTWVVRDDQFGWRSRPSNTSDWPECTIREANHALAREVWGQAVRLHNLATMPEFN